MLMISIIANNVGASPFKHNTINKGLVTQLPKKLAERVIEVLNILNTNDVSKIEYDRGHFILTHRDKNYSIDPCPEFLNDDFLVNLIETCKLLDWYLEPHFWLNFPGTCGGTPQCLDCHMTQPKGVPHSKYCAHGNCPSHAKWAEIIEGYEPPKPQRNEEFAQAVEHALTNMRKISECE